MTLVRQLGRPTAWAAAFAMLLAAGCVSKGKYNKKVAEANQLKQDLADANKKYDAMRTKLQRLEATAMQVKEELKKRDWQIKDLLTKVRKESKRARDLARKAGPTTTPRSTPPPAGGGDWGGEVKGNLDAAVIRTTVKGRMGKIKACYDKARKKNPKLAGKVVVSFKIDRRGKVRGAKVKGVTLRDRSLTKCVRKVWRKIRFPKPKGRKSVKVRYPLEFSPG